jgi:hypothetical protein
MGLRGLISPLDANDYRPPNRVQEDRVGGEGRK